MDIDILNQTTGNIYWKDLNGKFLGCNLEFAKLVGLNSPAEVIGKTNSELLNGRLSEENLRQLEIVDKEVTSKGVEKIVQEIGLDAQGKLMTYLTKKIPLRDKNHKIIGLIGTSIDVSQLVTIQSNIINYSVGNLFWKDLHGRFMGANNELLKMHGFKSMDEILGKTEHDFFHKDEARIKTVIETDQEVMTTGKEVIREEFGATPKGELKVYLTKKGPLRDETGKIIGLMGTSIDITQQKNAERIKTEFLENMRHDIRTPLSGIMGFAQLIKDEMKGTKIEGYADNMMASSQALMNLLNEILEVIQITSGHIPHTKNRFNLKTTLATVLDLEAAKAQSENLTLTLEYDKKLPLTMLGDDTRIHRILLELINNALKFTHKGSISVKAELKKRLSPRNLIIALSVTDTGIGIPEDKQHEIFAEFTRLTPSYAGVYRGSGLGLTIVKQYVKDIDGTIQVLSKPNKGSTFTVTFPLKESLIQEKPKKTKFSTAEHALDKNKKAHVLLIEDQDMPREVAQELLKKLGCEVDIAKTGQAGILQSKAKKYDLIFMDIGLPDMNGNQAAKEIRIWEQVNDDYTPIVGLTAHVGPENKQQSIEAGMDAIFSKPLVKETALDILRAFVYKTKVMIIQPTEKISNNKIIDLELGAKLVGKDAAFAKSMIATLVETFPDEIKAIKTAYKQQNWDKVYDVAHRVNGGVSYCGTPRLQKAASTLQTYLNSGKTKDREMLYQKFLDEIDAVKDAYKTL